MKTKKGLLLLLCLFNLTSIWALHNRAGEMHFKQIDQFTVEASAITYTTPNVPSDRDSLEICWGDGNCEWVMRSNGDGVIGANNIQKNLYTKIHVYSELGNYLISMTDPYRNDEIININGGFSDNVPFHMSTELRLLDLNFNVLNTAPHFLIAPSDVGFTNLPFYHLPIIFDEDGDSLAFELITPMQSVDLEVPNYLFPDEIEGGMNNSFDFDPLTGMIAWDSPQIPGEYNIAFVVKSYRNGEEIDRTIRDMQILILPYVGAAPTMSISVEGFPTDVISEVSVGDTVRVDFFLTNESSTNNPLGTSLVSGLFNYFDEGATFSVPGTDPPSIRFQWIVREEQVRAQPYQVGFRLSQTHATAHYATFANLYFSVLQTTSNQSVPSKLKFQIYPNPTSEGRVYLNLPFVAESNYAVYSMDGRLLLSGELAAGSKWIDLPTMPKGACLLKVKQDGKVGTQTIIIE